MRVAHELISEIDRQSNRSLSSYEAKILHWVFVSGLLNFKTLWQVLFPDTNRKNLHRTARRLVKRGLIEPVTVPGLSLPGWRLGRDLLKRYSKTIGLHGCGPYRFVASIENHNANVRELARLVDSSRETLWVAHESMLRANEMALGSTQRKLLDLSVPDLVTEFAATKKRLRIAWEVELTQKSGGRLERILENRMTSVHWDGVVYVLGPGVSRASIFEKSKDVTLTSPRLAHPDEANPILFVSWENLQNFGFEANGLGLKNEMSIDTFLSEIESIRDGGADDAGSAPPSAANIPVLDISH